MEWICSPLIFVLQYLSYTLFTFITLAAVSSVTNIIFPQKNETRENRIPSITFVESDESVVIEANLEEKPQENFKSGYESSTSVKSTIEVDVIKTFTIASNKNISYSILLSEEASTIGSNTSNSSGLSFQNKEKRVQLFNSPKIATSKLPPLRLGIIPEQVFANVVQGEERRRSMMNLKNARVHVGKALIMERESNRQKSREYGIDFIIRVDCTEYGSILNGTEKHMNPVVMWDVPFQLEKLVELADHLKKLIKKQKPVVDAIVLFSLHSLKTLSMLKKTKGEISWEMLMKQRMQTQHFVNMICSHDILSQLPLVRQHFAFV